ncbi:MAG: c-type cytochrome [Neomegalonema sp.]|nr:c-type cytochrome [Neomegalonema sp.]
MMWVRRHIYAAARLGALVAPLLAANAASAGDEKAGARVFKRCAVCHDVGPKAQHKLGPHLNGIMGRKAGHTDGFVFSKAMKKAGDDGLVWTDKTISEFVKNPRKFVKGTRMTAGALRSADDRANLVAFLRQYSDKPSDIPEAPRTVPPTSPDLDPKIFAVKGDPEYGEYLSSECVSCHLPGKDDKGIPSIAGWGEKDFVAVMHAFKIKKRESPVMQMIAGRLSDEEIASLAAYFAKATK